MLTGRFSTFEKVQGPAVSLGQSVTQLFPQIRVSNSRYSGFLWNVCSDSFFELSNCRLIRIKQELGIASR
jgi:hypothetical protein